MADKRIPAALVRRLWADEARAGGAIAAELGLTRPNLWRRAKALGLPDRKAGRKFRPLPPAFDTMWCDGVRVADLSALCGLSASSISRRAKLRGLPVRQPGAKPIPLAIWHELQLGRRMQASAGQTQVAVRAHQAMEDDHGRCKYHPQ